MAADEQKLAAKDDLLRIVVSNAPSIVFGLQAYAYETRRLGDFGEARRLLKLAADINKLSLPSLGNGENDE